MRKLTAIFLSLLFLFNLAGYQLLFHYLIEKSESKYEAIIDGQMYDESSLLTLKVDINMPYQADNTEFERVNGEVTVNGVAYQYVKRRFSNGQLILLCLPNEDKTKLQKAKTKFAEWSNDVTANKNTGEKSKSTILKNIASDYDDQNVNPFATITFTLATNNVLIDEDLPHLYFFNSPSKPPEITG